MRRKLSRRGRRKSRRYAFLAIAGLAALTVFAALYAQAAELPCYPGSARRKQTLNTPAPAASAVPDVPESTVLDIPCIDQSESWPTGCESVCAVMALRYAGVEITVDEFIDGYLPLGNPPYQDREGNWVGCDPRQAFPGDPRSADGWGCYAPVIQSAVKNLLLDREIDSLSVRDLSGQDLDALCETYIKEGTPVLVWATIDMEEPQISNSFFLEDTWEEFQWVYPMHCLLLVGWDENGYYFNDPLAGQAVFYEKEAVEQAYAGLGRQALAIG